eukprot:TRINITY_DN12912_c0_g1_i1.p1 TRINITY_DN12912_c0_g1~~TRINITY_DN12912_c0_g1_i1.p1  ORF type:complete len:515 (+),score=96.13 TRINITY_DN12912_c0_g1_i1:325-1869(+)
MANKKGGVEAKQAPPSRAGFGKGLVEKAKSTITKCFVWLSSIAVLLLAVGIAYLLQAAPTDFKSQTILEQKVKFVTSLVPYWNPGVDDVVSYRLLHLAASVPFGAPLVRLALWAGADVHSVDTKNSTALHYAAAKSNYESMRVLIHAGANIHHTNIHGHFPYEILSRDGWDDIDHMRTALKLLSHYEAEKLLSETKDTSMKSTSVDRIPYEQLSFKDFFDNYALKKKPVIITGYQDRVLKTQWNREYFYNKCKNETVSLQYFDPKSTAWANLRDGRDMPLGDWLDLPKDKINNTMVFDWPLPANCPDTMDDFTMPKYFADDYIQHTQFSGLKNSWPSLFIAHAGTRSGLHIDAYGSNFWMLMIEGHKQWRFFDPSESPLLYPNFASNNFYPDVYFPDYAKYPLLALTSAYDCVLEPGDLLFVPAGTPHQVRNLDDTIAISGNYIDKSCLDLALKETYLYKLEEDEDGVLYDLLLEVNTTVNYDIPDLPFAAYHRGYWPDSDENYEDDEEEADID